MSSCENRYTLQVVAGLLLCLITCTKLSTVASSPTSNLQCHNKLINETLRRKCGEGKPPLYLLVMAPYPNAVGVQPSWPGGPAVVPGALLAAEHINCHPTLLPDYQVKIIVSDGGCNIGSKASANLSANVYLTNQTDGNVVGIVGGACSESAFTVARLVRRNSLSLVQIAPTATSPQFVLEEEEKYPNTIRLIVNALVFVEVFTEIIKKQNYSEVAILYDANRRYMIDVSSALVKELGNNKVKVGVNERLTESYLIEPLMNLKGNHRLIFVFAGTGIAVNLLCVAFKEEMLYPEYQFVFINRRARSFLKDVVVKDPDTEEELYKCSKAQMKEALETATFFEPRATRDDRNTTTISGCTYKEIEEQYKQVLTEHLTSLNISEEDLIDTEYENAYYDSTWALALSLNYSQPLVNLSTYRYGQLNETGIIIQQFFDLSFEGATGPVKFSNETNDIRDVAIVDILQQFDGRESASVAHHSQETKLVVNNGTTLKFINESIFRKEQPRFIHPPVELGHLAIAMAIIVGLGIGVIHSLNGGCGDIKLVKATSFQLNHLIFSGCYLLLIGVIAYACLATLFIADNNPNCVLFGVFCNIQVWVFTYSFSLIFGTICMKTWRIWRIFSHFSSNPLKFAADYILVSVVFGLIIIDTVYLLVWTSIDPLTMNVQISTTKKIAVCHGSNLHIWLPILASYKSVIIFIVLYLSISTRKVNKLEFKQTKSINMLIYLLLFVIILGLTPYAIVTASQSFDLGALVAAFVLYSGAFVTVSIMCAIFVFLPPIYPTLQRKWKRWRLSLIR